MLEDQEGELIILSHGSLNASSTSLMVNYYGTRTPTKGTAPGNSLLKVKSDLYFVFFRDLGPENIHWSQYLVCVRSQILQCFDAFEGSSSIEEGYHFLDSTSELSYFGF